MTRSITLRRNAGYAGLTGAYWMLYCVAMSYSSVFLLARGYANAEIGLIVALGHILGMVFQPLAAAAADRKPTAPVAVIGLTAVLTGLSFAAFFLLPGKSLAVSAVFVLLLSFIMTLQPLVNAFSFHLERLGAPIYFGIDRSFGSLFYAVSSVILGMLTVRFSRQVIPLSGILLTFLFLAILFLLRREGTPPPAGRDDPAASHIGLREYARRYRSFLFLLAATVFLFFGHSVILNFIMQIVANVGGTSEDMGRLCSFNAMVELPAMLLFDRLHRRFSCTTLLKFSAVFFVVKNLAVLCAASMTGLYIALSFQALSFPLITAGSVRYAGEHIALADQNKAQAYITAMLTLGNVCASGVGGILFDTAGIPAGLAVAAVSSVIGLALMVFGMKREPAPTTVQS
ncbi:MAG: MFS transporter [Oscillospiraceae bacterium]